MPDSHTTVSPPETSSDTPTPSMLKLWITAPRLVMLNVASPDATARSPWIANSERVMADTTEGFECCFGGSQIGAQLLHLALEVRQLAVQLADLVLRDPETL